MLKQIIEVRKKKISHNTIHIYRHNLIHIYRHKILGEAKPSVETK